MIDTARTCPSNSFPVQTMQQPSSKNGYQNLKPKQGGSRDLIMFLKNHTMRLQSPRRQKQGLHGYNRCVVCCLNFSLQQYHYYFILLHMMSAYLHVCISAVCKCTHCCSLLIVTDLPPASIGAVWRRHVLFRNK